MNGSKKTQTQKPNMKFGPDYQPEFESYKALLLEMARDLSLQSLLETIVKRLAGRPHIALAPRLAHETGRHLFGMPSAGKMR